MQSPGQAHPFANPMVPAGPHRLRTPVVGGVTLTAGLPGSASWLQRLLPSKTKKWGKQKSSREDHYKLMSNTIDQDHRPHTRTHTCARTHTHTHTERERHERERCIHVWDTECEKRE